MNSYQNQTVCEYADDIVAYLYEETGGREKSLFEAHLAKCSGCAGELAAFSEVHLAVADWREAEFSHLNLPEIVIPYSPVKRAFAVEQQKFWFVGVREILAFSSVWKTAAAMTLLVFCAALIFLAVKFNGKTEIAGTSNVVVPIVETLPETEQLASAEDGNNRISAKSADEKTSVVSIDSKSKSTPAAVNTSTTKYKNPVKREMTAQANHLKTPNLKMNAVIASIPKSNQNSAVSSRLNSEDEDLKDDSLRLSELLDESDKND